MSLQTSEIFSVDLVASPREKLVSPEILPRSLLTVHDGLEEKTVAALPTVNTTNIFLVQMSQEREEEGQQERKTMPQGGQGAGDTRCFNVYKDI